MAGRVLTEEELRKVGDFCERHDLTIVSDEIHSDLILDEGLKHISMLALDNGVRTVCTMRAVDRWFGSRGEARGLRSFFFKC